jgi:hypothetical protein
MWYELGQALLYVILTGIAIYIFLKPLARITGHIKKHLSQTQKGVIQEYHQGQMEEEEKH